MNTLLTILSIAWLSLIIFRIYIRNQRNGVRQVINPVEGGQIHILTIVHEGTKIIQSWNDVVGKFDAETMATGRRSDAKLVLKNYKKNKKLFK